jgi:hypothetical protein
MRDTGWLQDLKKGDQVIVRGSGYGHHDRVTKVERLTKTLIILEGGGRYRKATGYRSGERSSWNFSYLVEYTDGAALAIAHRELVESLTYKINKNVLDDVPMDKLLQIARLLP